MPPPPALAYEVALARALASAASDVIVHVVQLDGRPLPPQHMLPPRLLRLNASWPPVKADSYSAANSEGAAAGAAPQERMIVLHDIWKLERDEGGGGGPAEWRAATPRLETTAAHREVLRHAAESFRAAAAAAAPGDANFGAGGRSRSRGVAQAAAGESAAGFDGGWRPSAAGESDAAAAGAALLRVGGRSVVVLAKVAGKVGWACGRSLLLGAPPDWAWATRDGRRAARHATRAVTRWWAGDGSSSSSSSHDDDDDDDPSGSSGDGDDDDGAVGGFAGFGAGFSASGVDALDKLFRSARLAVLPLRRTPSGFDQVVSQMVPRRVSQMVSLSCP
jgi:hypothetical protein